MNIKNLVEVLKIFKSILKNSNTLCIEFNKIVLSKIGKFYNFSIISTLRIKTNLESSLISI